MAIKKETLEKLIDFVSEIGSQNSNAWFVEKLVRTISNLDARPITTKILYEIHEHCIADIIHSQAKGFYVNFRIKQITPALISLYCQMEQHRRNDNFEEFCESLFEQIELISRTLFTDNEIKTIEKNHNAQLPNGKKLGQVIFYEKFSSYHEVFAKTPAKWGVEYLICSIVYTHYYDALAPSRLPYKQFGYLKKTIEDLCIIRNMNSHPGGEFNDFQKARFNKLQADKHRKYIKFLSFLEDFTVNVNNNIKQSLFHS